MASTQDKPSVNENAATANIGECDVIENGTDTDEEKLHVIKNGTTLEIGDPDVIEEDLDLQTENLEIEEGDPDVIEEDVALEVEDLEPEEEAETRTEMIVRDLILEEPDPAKSRQTYKEKAKQNKQKLERKLEQERRIKEKRKNKEFTVGWPVTVKNILIWVLLMCLIYFIKGMIEQYLLEIRNVLTIELRHQEIEVEFFTGLEEFGVMITLIFVSFYAGIMKKPWVIFAGVLVMFVSCIFFIIPPFAARTMTVKAGPAVTHLEASLCYPKDNNTACNSHINLEDKVMVFSMFCVSRILSGIGIALVMPLCITYIYDNADKSKMVIYIGLVFCSNYIGQFIGSILGRTVPYASLPGHPWVIIFIVAAVILLIISVFIPPFPTWFKEVPSYAKIRIPKVSLMAQQVENQRSKKKPVGTRNGIKKVRKRETRNGAIANRNTASYNSAENKKETSFNQAVETELPTVTVTKAEKQDKVVPPVEDDLEISHVVFGNLAPTVAMDTRTASDYSGARSSGATPSITSKSESKVSEETERSSNEIRKKEASKDSKGTKSLQEKKVHRRFRLRNFSYFLMRQICDPVFVLLSVGFSLVTMLFRGYYYTLGRYLELEFWAPGHADPAIIAGVCIPLAAAVGVMVGTLFMWKLNWPQRRLLVLTVIITAAAALGFFILMAFKCHDTLLEISDKIGKNEVNQQSCGIKCSCSQAVLTPVCQVGGNVTYESPCHAGCHVKTRNLWTDNSIQCSCGERLYLGVCGKADTCKSLVPVSIIIFIIVLAVSSITVPVIMMVIRNAEPREKYIALGFFWWLSHVIGHLLGPVIFNAILSSSCIHRAELGSCSEEEDVCWNYNLDKLRLLNNGIMGCLLAVAAGCFAGVYVYLRWKKQKETCSKDIENNKADVDQNDNENIKTSGGIDKSESDENIYRNEAVNEDNDSVFNNNNENIQYPVETKLESTHSNPVNE